MKKIFYSFLLINLWACKFNRTENLTVGFSTLPTFNLLLIDSTTIFNTKNIATGKSTVLMYISPSCEHCQNQTKDLLNNIYAFKNVRIYIFTPAPLKELIDFYNTYRLSNCDNIIVGKDYEYTFYNLLKVKMFPYTVIYNNRKQLVRLYKGEAKIEQIINAMHI